jgi:hypothetical protein
MRIKDVLLEKKIGKLNANDAATMHPSQRFAGTSDRTYDLNRIMMATACSDGSGIPAEFDHESWIGRNNLAQPYTPVERDMMLRAYQALGVAMSDAVKNWSEEPKDTNVQSPISPVK